VPVAFESIVHHVRPLPALRTDPLYGGFRPFVFKREYAVPFRTSAQRVCYGIRSVAEPAVLHPGEHPVCFKCQRPTSVKAVLPLGPILYLRCEECGSAWSIASAATP
jgi:hypothetical protein